MVMKLNYYCFVFLGGKITFLNFLINMKKVHILRTYNSNFRGIIKTPATIQKMEDGK